MVENPSEFVMRRVCGGSVGGLRRSRTRNSRRNSTLKVTALLFWVTSLQACAQSLPLICFHVLVQPLTSPPGVQQQVVGANEPNQGGSLMSWWSIAQTLTVGVSCRGQSWIRLREAEAEHPVKVAASSHPPELGCISTRPPASSRLLLPFLLLELYDWCTYSRKFLGFL